MAILFVGSRAVDLGGACVSNTSPTYYDADYSFEAAQVSAIFNGGSNGFNIYHEASVSDTTWYHFYVRTGGYLNGYSDNDGYWFTIRNAAGDIVCRWDILDGNQRSQVFGDTTAQGPDFSLPERTKLTVDVKVVVNTDITMECYINGSLMSSVTVANTGGKLGPTLISMEHEKMVYTISGDKFYYSEFVVTDNESTMNWRISTLFPASQGTYDEWAGGYNDIVNFNDGLSMSTPSANKKESWGLSTYLGPASTSRVRALVTSFIGDKGQTGPTKITPFIRHDSVDVDGSPLEPDGKRLLSILTNNPQTGLPWDTADLATLEIGVKSST